jgi:hypothetical protein
VYINHGLRSKKLKNTILLHPHLFDAVNAGMNNNFTSTASEAQMLKAVQKN